MDRVGYENGQFGSSGGLLGASGWKWVPGHCFGDENGQFARFGGLLGDNGLAMASRAWFWR